MSSVTTTENYEAYVADTRTKFASFTAANQKMGSGKNIYGIINGRFQINKARTYMPILDQSGFSKPDRRSVMITLEGKDLEMFESIEQMAKDFLLERGHEIGIFNAPANKAFIDQVWSSSILPGKEGYSPSLCIKMNPLEGGAKLFHVMDATTFSKAPLGSTFPEKTSLETTTIMDGFVYVGSKGASLGISWNASQVMYNPAELNNEEGSFVGYTQVNDNGEPPFSKRRCVENNNGETIGVDTSIMNNQVVVGN
tara:strand:+ start:3300 stop:4061 length:762 start_codon:yes stop_codon:yes gene_type:complete